MDVCIRTFTAWTRSAAAVVLAWSLCAPEVPGQCLHELKPSIAGNFGGSLDLEGDRAVASGGSGLGSVHVFDRGPLGWSETARLLSAGWLVSLSGDRLLIGSPTLKRASIHERTPSGWVKTQTLQPSNPLTINFGSTVFLSGDRAFVAADAGPPYPHLYPGLVHVFEWTPNGWVETEVLRGHGKSTGVKSDIFGNSISAVGSEVVIGAPLDNAPGGVPTGAVYVFERLGTGWVQTSKILGSSANSYFGDQVAFSGDRIVASALLEGVVRVFVRGDAGWVEEARFGDQFVSSVAIDGNRIATSGGQSFQTSFLSVFERRSTGWVRTRTLGQGVRYVALSGRDVAFGSPFPGVPGSAFVLEDHQATRFCSAKVNSLGCAPSLAYSGCPSASLTDGFQLACHHVLNQKRGLLLYGTGGRAALPFQGGTLCIAAPVRRTGQQGSGGSAQGSDCSGSYSIDMNAFAAGIAGGSPVPALQVPGTVVACQWWAHDPGDPFGSSLSAGLEYSVLP